MPDRNRLEFALLGPVVVRTADGAVDVTGLRQRALLVRLLVSANQVVPASRLIEDLWEGAAPAGASSTLQSYISRLRHLLGPDCLRSRHGGYVLEVGADALDVTLFEAELRAGLKALASGDLQTASQLLARGLGRWRSSALADVAGALWAASEVSRLEELRLQALEAWLDVELLLGRHRDVAVAAEGAVTRSPLRERVWGQWMLALYRDGRQADALRAYRRLRTNLGEELGIEPGRELQALEEAILLQKPELDWPGPPARPPGTPSAGTPPAEGAVEEVVYRPMAPQVAGARRGGLFGRASALRQLTDAWGSARQDRLRVATVSGEAGIGKTRLVAELAAGVASEGGAVLWGRCDEDATSPYEPFTEMLSPYFRDAPQPLLTYVVGTAGADIVRLVPSLTERLAGLAPRSITDPETDRGHLLAALVAVMERVAATSPVLMVVDDVHNAPRGTLALLRHLARTASGAPLLIVVTYRDTDIDSHDGHPLHDLRADLAADGLLASVRLRGLDPRAVEELADSQAADAPIHRLGDLCDRTGGNPFFCMQLLRHVAESAAHSTGEGPDGPFDLPHGVRDVVRQRVERLGPGGRRVLAVAAVVGMEFDHSVMDRLITGDDDVLGIVELAVSAGLLDEIAGRPGRFRFVHALVQETLYAGLSAARRAMLHRQIGAVLADRHSPATAVAHHLAEGASGEGVGDAVAWLRRAAAELISLLAFEEAEAALLRALSLLDAWAPDDLSTRASVHLALAFFLGVCGDTTGQKHHAARSAEDARAARMPHLFADAAIERASWAEAGVTDTVAGDLLHEALSTVGDHDAGLRATLLAVTALRQGMNDGRGTAMDLLAAEAVRTARTVGDRSLIFEVLHFRAILLQGSPELNRQRVICREMEAIEEEEGSLLWESPGSHWGRMKALLGAADFLGWWDKSGLLRFRAVVELQAGDVDAFDRDRLAAAASWRAGSHLMGATLAMWSGLRALLDGRFAEAAQHADAMLRIAGDDLNFRSSWAAMQFQVARELGLLAQLKPIVEAAIAEAPQLVAFRAPLALLYADLGELDAARDVVGSLPDLQSLSGVVAASAILSQLAEIAARLDDRQLAAELFGLLTPYRGQLIVVTWGVYVLGAADRFLGLLAATMQRWDEADGLFSGALALELSIAAPPLTARTRVCWARALLERGDAPDPLAAGQLLDGAAKDAEALGMEVVISEIAELRLGRHARAVGSSPPRITG